MAELLSDADIFGTGDQASGLLSDEDIFGAAPESDIGRLETQASAAEAHHNLMWEASGDSFLSAAGKAARSVGPSLKAGVGGMVQAAGETPYYIPPGRENEVVEIAARDRISMQEAARKLGIDTRGPEGSAPRQIADAGKAIYEEAQGELDRLAPNVEERSPAWYMYQYTRVMGEMAPAVALSIATRKPMIGATQMGAHVGGSQYGGSRNIRERTPEDARTDAMFYGASELLTERIPLGILTKEGLSLGSRLTKAGMAEGIQESFTEALQIGYETGVFGDETTLGEATQRIIDAAVLGAGAGSSMAAVVEPFHRMRAKESPGEKPPGGEERPAPERPRAPLTEDDRASPLPDDLISEGKGLMDELLSDQEAGIPEGAVNADTILGAEQPQPAPVQPEAMEPQEQAPVQRVRQEDVEFVPTAEWQEVPEGAILPPGLQIRMDQQSGKTFARTMAEANEPLMSDADVFGESVDVQEGISVRVPNVEGDGSPEAPVQVQSGTDADVAAERVAEPTEAQKEAGNYRKGHVRVSGLDVSIENPKGSTRSGTDADGNEWSVEMPAHYGYVKRTEGADGDHVDVYIGDNPESDTVYVVDQIDADAGTFDEHKGLVGFPSEEAALAAYDAAFNDGRGPDRRGAVTPMSVEAFRDWLKDGDTRKPIAWKKQTDPAILPESTSSTFEESPERPASEGSGITERFEPQRYVAALKRYATNTKKPLKREKVAADLKIKPGEADRVIAALANQADAPITVGRDGTVRRKPQRKGPIDAVTYLADRGGINDNEGHDLKKGRNLQRFVPKAGPFIRKNGMSIDEAGEVLWNAGYFGPADTTPRPTEAEVLDFLEQAHGGRGFAPEDQDRADAAAQVLADEERVAAIETEIRDTAKSMGEVIGTSEVEAIKESMVTENMDAETATEVYIERLAVNVAEQMAKETGDDSYADNAEDIPFEVAREPDARAEGRPGDTRDESESEAHTPSDGQDGETEGFRLTAPESPTETTDDSQSDMFGTTDADREASARQKNRQAVEDAEQFSNQRTRSDKEQAPADSDGGLFEDAKARDQGNLVVDGISETTTSPDTLKTWRKNVPHLGQVGGWQLFDDRRVGKGFVLMSDERRVGEFPSEDAARQWAKENKAMDSKPTPQPETGGKIEDFGETLEGARKHYAEAYRERMADALGSDIAAVPLSKSWPEPDYGKLIEGGADPWTVAFVHAARDEVPNKPRQKWKLKQWVGQVEGLRGFSQELLGGEISKDAVQTALRSKEYQRLAGQVLPRVDLYQAVGHSKSLKGVRIAAGDYSMRDGVRFDPPKTVWTVEKQSKATAFSNWPRILAEGDTREQAIENFKKAYDRINLDKPAKKQVRFSLYSKRGHEGVFIGKKMGRDYVDLERFDEVKEARKYLAENEDKLLAKLERIKDIPDHRSGENEPRVGDDHRNGADVTPEQFSEAFGFRGVQFGNYVEGPRRQQDLNNAYDALMDMAGVLGVPPKALSLHGELGLAFGARGKGGKAGSAAHYERGKVVINLTKRDGAGSLAHEWWHALDNYFSRKRADEDGFVSERPYERGEGVRPEVVAAFNELVQSIKRTSLRERAQKLDRVRSKDYWTTGREMSARAFESYIIAKLQDQGARNDYLANVVSEDYWEAAAALGVGEGTGQEKTFPYPTAAEIPEIRAGFDHLFNTIETRETDQGVEMYRLSDEAPAPPATDAIDTIADDLKARMKQRGIDDKVSLRIVDSLATVLPDGTQRTADASYQPGRKLITVALDAKDGTWALDHETVHALRDLGLFKDAEWRVLENAARNDRKRMDEIRKRYEPAGLTESQLEEEAVADMFADWAKGDKKVKGFIRTAFERIRAFLESLGNALDGNGFRTAADVFGDVAAGNIGTRPATGQSGGMDTKFAAAWHGTPHDFDVFKTDHIGTGEGAQAYGWGLYFAGKKEVAEHYRNALSGHKTSPKYKGKAILNHRGEPMQISDDWIDDLSRFLEYAVDNDMTMAEAISEIRNQAGSMGFFKRAFSGAGDFLRLADLLEQSRATIGDAKGRLFKVDLAPHEDEYLYWDKPLSEQSEGVREALEPLIVEDSQMFVDKFGGTIEQRRRDDMSGMDWYLEMAAKLGSERAASEALAAVGIPGIKYLDGSSRNKGDGTYNYVIFDDSLVSVTEKFSLRPDAADSQENRNTVSQGFIARGQPIDRSLRIPFDWFGGVDEKGQWKPGLKLYEKAEKTLTESTFKDDGVFGWLNGSINAARTGLIDRYGLSDDYVKRERKLDLDKREIASKGQEILSFLQSEGIGADEAKVLQAVLTGEQIPDAEWDALAAPIRQAIDEMGQEAVQLGLVSPESYERNRGTYLHRVYMKHEGDQPALARWFTNFMANRRKKIQGDAFKGRGIFLDVGIDRAMQDVTEFVEGRRGKPQKGEAFIILDKFAEEGGLVPAENDAATPAKIEKRVFWPADKEVPARYGDEGYQNRGEWEVRRTLGNQITLWRDFTKDERTQMGEILDARYTIGKTFTLMANDLATGRFYRDIAKNNEWTRTATPNGKWVEAGDFRRMWQDETVEWVKVPDASIPNSGGKKKWGALSGKYVRAEIWRDLNEADIMMRPNLWTRLLTQWKLNKTARSPVVHMNNVMSNMVFMDLADVRMQDLVKGLRSYVSEDADFQEARDNGAFGSDIISQEIRRNVLQPILDDLQSEISGGNPVTQKFGMLGKLADGIWEKGKAFDRSMVELYRMEDEVFRMAMYMRRRSLGDGAENAADEARAQFLDYDIRAPWVNTARRTVLPFIAYTYRAVPVIAKSVATRPWKMAKYFAMAYAANALAYMIAPGDEDDERNSMREQEKGNTWIGTPRMMRMPYRDEHGNPVFLDIRRWIPAGDVFDMGQGHGAFPIPAPIQFGGPLMLGAELALNKSAFTGDEITNDLTDTAGDKAKKLSDWAWKSWMPSAAWIPGSWYWEKIGLAAKGATDSQGRPYPLPEAVMSSFGVKLKPQDVQENFHWRMYEFQKARRALKAEERRMQRLYERGIMSEEYFEESMRAIDEKYGRIDAEEQAIMPK